MNRGMSKQHKNFTMNSYKDFPNRNSLGITVKAFKSKKLSFTFLLSTLLFQLPFLLNAQEIVFRATLNKNKVTLNETFQLTYTIDNADGNNFKAPSLNDFYVVGGPNYGNSVKMINGSFSKSSSYTYYLQPKKEGTFNIGIATVEVNGRTLKSNSLALEVLKTGASNGNKQQNGGSQNQSIEQQIDENVFVRAVLDKDEVFQGEQVTATYKVYTRMSIGNITFSKMPAFNGFWTQDLENVQNLQFTKEVLKGVEYNVAILKKVALFPQRAGDLDVDPMELQTTVRIQTKSNQRSIWGDFFGTYQDVPHKLQSNKAKIKVKTLPTVNKPSDYNGVVGNFKMEVKVDKNTTNVDDPITLSIKISGDGNVKMIEKPLLDLPKDFDVFDPKTNESITKRNNTVTGYKTYDFLLVPRRPGEFKIPSFQFSYFDLSKRNYVTNTSPEFAIKVTGQASSNNTQNITGIKKEEVELLGSDIRYIKSNASFNEKSTRFFGTSIFNAGYITPFFLFIGLLLFKRRDDKQKGNVTLLKSKKANKVAAKRLEAAKKHLQIQDQKLFYNEISKAIYGYLSDKLNIQQSELNKENIIESLKSKQVAIETINKIFIAIDDCEMALFASVSSNDMNSTYANTENIINELEGVLK